MRSIPAKIIGKKLYFNEISFQKFAEKHNGRFCDIIVRVPKRSISQNSYYWLYLTVISHETGNDVDDLHGFFKRKFLPITSGVIVLKGGMQHTYKKLTSTTDLSKAEFGEYLDKICAETGVPLPDPEAAGFIPNSKPYEK